MINQVINKHLRPYEHDLPLPDRLMRWHWDRVAHNATPIFWCLRFIWWIPKLQWLYQLRCRNVNWRMKRYNSRLTAKCPMQLYNWNR